MTRKKKAVWFLLGLLILLGAIYVIWFFVMAFLVFGAIGFTILLPFPFAAALYGYVLMLQSLFGKTARK